MLHALTLAIPASFDPDQETRGGLSDGSAGHRFDALRAPRSKEPPTSCI